MFVTAWNNGKHHPSGAGYGLKLKAQDRDLYFQGDWKTVWLDLEGYSQKVEFNVDKPSFWGPNCRELISRHIGIWLIENNLAPWPKGKPPKLNLESLDGNKFLLKLPK